MPLQCARCTISDCCGHYAHSKLRTNPPQPLKRNATEHAWCVLQLDLRRHSVAAKTREENESKWMSSKSSLVVLFHWNVFLSFPVKASFGYDVKTQVTFWAPCQTNAIYLKLFNDLHSETGRAIAQAVSLRLPIAAARIRAQVRSCGVCGGRSDTGAGSLRVLRFPLSILTPPTAPHSSSIVRGWYNRPVISRCIKWTQSHPTPRNLRNYTDCTVLSHPYCSSDDHTEILG
jgi:hypothetical protein